MQRSPLPTVLLVVDGPVALAGGVRLLGEVGRVLARAVPAAGSVAELVGGVGQPRLGLLADLLDLRGSEGQDSVLRFVQFLSKSDLVDADHAILGLVNLRGNGNKLAFQRTDGFSCEQSPEAAPPP